MSEEKRSIIQSLWRELFDAPFDITCLSKDIISDCGVDAGNLTSSDIDNIFNGALDSRWDEIAFSFDEVLAYYLAFDHLTNGQFVRAIFISLFLGDAIRHGHGDWEFSFDKILELVWRNKNKSDCQFRMSCFRELLRE